MMVKHHIMLVHVFVCVCVLFLNTEGKQSPSL